MIDVEYDINAKSVTYHRSTSECIVAYSEQWNGSTPVAIKHKNSS